METTGWRQLFYYRRHPLLGPVITGCLLANERDVIARGLSICSLSEPMNKFDGRKKALGRAMKAAYTQKTSGDIRSLSVVEEQTFALRNFTFKEGTIAEYSAILRNLVPRRIDILQDTKEKMIVRAWIPYWYPVQWALMMGYRTKSTYLPLVNDAEKKLVHDDYLM